MKRVRILPQEKGKETHGFEAGQECNLIENKTPEDWMEAILSKDNQCIEGVVEGVTVQQWLSTDEYEVID